MKSIKTILGIVCLTMIIVSCQPAEDNSSNVAKATFEANSKTAMKLLEDWQSENVDYSIYADDYKTLSNFYGATDSTDLAMMKEGDINTFAMLDFELQTEPDFLPGVNVDTKEIDGSVRLYSQWKITASATDSTEARSGNVRMYHAWVFNEEGKISMSLVYGDFGGLSQDIWPDNDGGDM